MPTVLDVGSGSALIPLPPHYQGWKRVRLDIDARMAPDLMLDARELKTQTPAFYDAVLCRHNLEHFHRHDGLKVIAGIRHVLKHDGFAEVYVPDLGAVMERVVQQKLDIDDILYQSRAGPILVRDVFYGYQPEIASSGQEFYAHRTGFTRKALYQFLKQADFRHVFVGTGGEFEIGAIAFCSDPKPKQAAMLNIPPHLIK